MVESDYVVLLSADDLLVPGSLARATALMEAHPSRSGFVYGIPVDFTDRAARSPHRGQELDDLVGSRMDGAGAVDGAATASTALRW